jgi:hypothetical protein
MKTIMGYEAPLVPPPQDYKGDFFKGQSVMVSGFHVSNNVITTNTLENLEHNFAPTLYKFWLMLNGHLLIKACHVIRLQMKRAFRCGG